MTYYNGVVPDVIGLARPPEIMTDVDRLVLYAGTLSDGMVAVEFVYVYAHDQRTTGLEVTVYAADGAVVASQDYG
jgi:hypothetical protein